jgi:hypothetical protein
MNVTVTEVLHVARPPDVVFDFTQDYARRREWDRSILEAEVLDAGPLPKVRIRGKGGLRGVLEHRLFDRPRRTSVTLTHVESMLLAGGAGSWSYAPCEGGTLWTQTNALALEGGFTSRILGPIVRAILRRATRDGMQRAKRIVEQSDPQG